MRTLALTATLFLFGCPSSGGPAGPQGPAGTAGSKGEPGLMGPAGMIGPAGMMGGPGVAGPQGLQGPAGMVLILDGGAVIGPAGSSVAVTPIATGGVVCPTGGVRVTQLSDGGISNVCNGATGATGAMGAMGPMGAMGATGATGATGAAGPMGAPGVGSPGPAGATGSPGPIGPTGSTGAAGPAGAAGPSGSAGPAGPPGAVLYLDGGVVLLSPDLVSFAGFTTATFTGNLGGNVGANAKCAAEFPGSSLCTVSDYAKSNPTVAVGAAVGAWVDFNRYASGERSSSGCSIGGQAWIDSGSGNAGPVVLPTGGYLSGGLPGQACSTARPLTCCLVPRTVSFAGFTAATFSGNLGGNVGANAKCGAEFPGSFLCTVSDYAKTNPTVAVGAAVGAWVDFNRYASGERSSSGCSIGGQAWIDSGSGNAGPVVLPTGGYLSGGLPGQACTTARPLTCCR